MGLNQLKEQLQYNTPEELTQIEPGQITYFISKEGITQRIASDIFHLAINQDSFYDEKTRINIVPTNRKLLIDSFAGRIPQKEGLPYKVVIGTVECLEEFEDTYLSGCIEEKGKEPFEHGDGIPHPIVITIDPADIQVGTRQDDTKLFTCPYMNEGDGGGMQALIAEKNTPTLIEMQNKIKDLLSRCARYGYDIDVVGLKNKAIEAQRLAKEYQLRLNIQTKEWNEVTGRERRITVCDLFIDGDGVEHQINLNPAEKALYLTTIVQGGFYLSDVSFGFLEDMATIFKQIPGHQEKENGLASGNASVSGIGVMKKHIRDAIISAIGFGPAVDEFAIEGYRGQEVSIRKATKKMADQIREYFGL